MEPLATYRERVVRGIRMQERLFLLFEDRVDIQLTWAGRTTQTRLLLEEFRSGPPEHIRLRLRLGRRANLAAIIVMLVLCGVLLAQVSLPALKNAAGLGPLITGVIGGLSGLLVLALVLAWRFRRPIEVVKFFGLDGKVRLDLLKSGPDAPRFEEFVSQVRKAIGWAGRE